MKYAAHASPTPALLTDLYQLTMAQSYWAEEMDGDAVFTLFARRLPPRRNVLVACGLQSVLDALEAFCFDAAALAYLRTLAPLTDAFVDWLASVRFTGDVAAVPEGTPVFAGEPILEVVAPLPQAQLIETLVMNQIHVQTVLASKAARVVAAAAGRPVVDFGARRTHGSDAALKGARAFYIGGVAATSNVWAGQVYGLPVTGTMAHSYVQAHVDEAQAFRAFTRMYPDTTLLLDTYDTLAGVRRVIALAEERGDACRLQAVRLDSGDLGALARAVRQELDAAGLSHIKILASGSLHEDAIAALVAGGALIDGFGVGTGMGVARDAPSLDLAYKLCAYRGTGRMKLSRGKPVLPGRKQVFRTTREKVFRGDTVARAQEQLDGAPLLVPVMRNGRRTATPPPLAEVRGFAQAQWAALPPPVRGLSPAEPAYPVAISEALTAYRDRVAAQLRRQM